MKYREPRRKAFVPARLRVDQQWMNVHVLDISSRGFKLKAVVPPPRGAYVELCRGRQTVIARVVWSQAPQFGVRTQDRVSPDLFLQPGEAPPAPATGVAGVDGAALIERRSERRRREDQQRRAERSRLKGRAMEYGWVAAFGGLGAMLVFTMVQEAVARPMAAVVAALH